MIYIFYEEVKVDEDEKASYFLYYAFIGSSHCLGETKAA